MAGGRGPLHLRDLPVVERRRLDRTVLELRQAGLGYPSISTVLDVYEGYDVTPDAVRSWLYRLGAPKNQNKTRPAPRGGLTNGGTT